MTELLIIKAEEDYYRLREDGLLPCAFDKASVFPLSRAEEAQSYCHRLQESGVSAKLMKLTIVEEPYVE